MSPQLRRSPVALLSCSILLLLGGALAPAGAYAHKRQRSQALGEVAPIAGAPAGGALQPGSSSEPAATEATPRVREHAHGKCELSLEASAEKVPAGETVTLHGALVCPEGTSVGGETITISETQRVGGVSSSSTLAPVTAGEDGSFEVTTAPLTARSLFVARSPLARHGARALVRATPKVTLDGPAAPGAQLAAHDSRATHTGRPRFTFAGTVDPAMAGTRVALQYQYPSAGDSWRTVAFSRVGEGGRYSFVHAFRSTGQVSVRVIAHPKGELPAASEPLGYEIVGPAAHVQAPLAGPTLTVSPPPSTVQAGTTLTFSGTLTPGAATPPGTPGAATQVVDLERANPGGFGFRVVASASVSAGTYSIPYTFGHPGTAVMRIKVPAGAGASTSAPYTITVTPAPATGGR